MAPLQLELAGPDSAIPNGVVGATPRLTPRELKRAKLAEKRKRSALASMPGNAVKKTAATGPGVGATDATGGLGPCGAASSHASAETGSADVAGPDEIAANPIEPSSDTSQSKDDCGDNDRIKRPRQQESTELSQLFDEGLSQCAVECAKKPSAPSPTEDDATCARDETSSSRDGLAWQELCAVPAYDASLKERCKVTSSQPFDWTTLSAAAEQAAVERFAQFGSRNVYGSTQDEERLDGTDFAEALMHWRYPESPLPPSLRKTFARNIAGGAAARDYARNDDKQYCLARLAEWGRSFRSLYSAFSNGGCSEVYVISKAFTVIFAKRTPSERFAGDDGYCAVLTRSTRGLRQRLEEEFIDYVLPREAAAAPGTESEASRDGVVDEAEAAEIKRFVAQADADTVYKEQSKDVRDGTPSSLLVSTGGIEGASGMYEFLLNYVLNGEGELDDVPTLLSTCPFHRASVGQATWENLGVTYFGSARGVRQGDGPCYTLDISGMLLPGNLARLYAELHRRQPQGYQVRLKTTEKTRGVNVALGTPSGWAAPWMDDDGVGAQKFQTASNLQQVPQSHVISKVECRAGQFRVQTSSTGNA